MRWTAVFVFSSILAAGELSGNIHTVYVMPMTHGLDQYVANRLTREHVFEVVADPQRADAIFTDRLGASLEYELEKLHPTPKAAGTQNEADDTGKSAKEDTSKDAAKSDTTPRQSKFITEKSAPATFSSGRQKGTLFLVDAKSRAVLWSLYEKPGRSAPNNLDRTAKRVVDRLKQDLAGK
ncbi:MAG TPA: hypothetical protein VJN43_21190 [Bryobacteraceae bacterium]|nr:hypothetical protein [Bryobacteraceae bacterium]